MWDKMIVCSINTDFGDFKTTVTEILSWKKGWLTNKYYDEK